jgi:hypothetical protein
VTAVVLSHNVATSDSHIQSVWLKIIWYRTAETGQSVF